MLRYHFSDVHLVPTPAMSSAVVFNSKQRLTGACIQNEPNNLVRRCWYLWSRIPGADRDPYGASAELRFAFKGMAGSPPGSM